MYPRLRQSLLAKMDMCHLSALFDLRYANGWSTHPQAAGTLFHRTMAEILQTLQRTGEQQIPEQEAMEILYEQARQRGVPLHERICVSAHDLKLVRQGVLKMTHHKFTVDRIVAIERRLKCFVRYQNDAGVWVDREITGQPDAMLLGDEPDEMVVLDWKLTWGLPPEPRDPEKQDYDDTVRISYEGYIQQRIYSLLVLRTLPQINRVTLREFYPLWGQARNATILRSDLEHIEREVELLAEQFDTAVMAGSFLAGTQQEGDAWPASPGKHCSFCARPGACPIRREVRGEGAIETSEQAERAAAEREVVSVIRDQRTKATKAWVETHGPIPVKAAKGRRMLGWVTNGGGKRAFKTYTPDDSDMAPHDPRLERAMEESAREAEAAT